MLSATEVKMLHEELQNSWSKNSTLELLNLKQLVHDAVSNNLPLVFFGTD